MKRVLVLTLAAVIFILPLTACEKKEDAVMSGALKEVAVKPAELIEPVYGEEAAAPHAAALGANDFAFALASELMKNKAGENFVCSPLSAWLPLAALANATTDETAKEQLIAALGAAGISAADLNTAASRMLYGLNLENQRRWIEENKDYEQEFHNPLKIVNAIFVDDEVTLKKEFAQSFADFYRGTAFNTDFQSSGAADAVNKWASDNTEGLITDVIREFDPNTVAAIANAVYFSDRWQSEFDPSRTKDGVFYAPTGETTASYMEKSGDSLSYYESDELQAIRLGFLTGGSMYILLPKDGTPEELISSLDFEEIRNGTSSASGALYLPKFKIAGDAFDLKPALEALGVPLFDEALAPLTGGLIEENLNVWLSAASQKAMIEVDEKGTTAAAVTVMAAAGTAMPQPTEPFEMRCDRPFAFVLCGYTYDAGSQVLFVGAVNEPQ